MILERDWRAENCKDSVARRLRNVSAVSVHRIDHKLECRIDNRARLFGIEVLDHLHRSLDISEECGDGLPFTFMGGQVGQLRFVHGFARDRLDGGGGRTFRIEEEAAIATELRGSRILRSALWTLRGE